MVVWKALSDYSHYTVHFIIRSTAIICSSILLLLVASFGSLEIGLYLFPENLHYQHLIYAIIFVLSAAGVIWAVFHIVHLRLRDCTFYCQDPNGTLYVCDATIGALGSGNFLTDGWSSLLRALHAEQEKLLFLVGEGGALYNPHSLPKSARRIDSISYFKPHLTRFSIRAQIGSMSTVLFLYRGYQNQHALIQALKAAYQPDTHRSESAWKRWRVLVFALIRNVIIIGLWKLGSFLKDPDSLVTMIIQGVLGISLLFSILVFFIYEIPYWRQQMNRF